MSEYRQNEIIYEEGWRESAPVVNNDTPIDEEPFESKAPTEERERSKPLLITIQLILCLIAALVLFLLKAMDSEGYYSFMDYYRAELQKPIVSQDVFESADVTKLFTQDNVTVQATPDETAHSED